MGCSRCTGFVCEEPEMIGVRHVEQEVVSPDVS